MKNNVQFEQLIPSLYNNYITIGTKAYNQHYRHLWPNGDTSTYIQNSFTKEVLLKEEQDKNTVLYLLKLDGIYVGLLKINLDMAVAELSKSQALYLDKIYILKEFTGLGIGRETLKFIENKAKELSKKAIFLESMQNGPALPFYLANNFSIINTTKVPFENVIEEEKPMFVLLKKI
ncbi:GNAT family N-acetyltransferase [uncultured Maribacter sp.]|uniref:GNAT family N-acetyltransferase n=1 Tax=uncultured Maribacter sp. TaxID=431308 RepID=UPI0030EE7C11|tara:strand:+ start:90377 stop:90904 length:528 start_codon:yes stop_codon:yes gene_type:complete